MMNIQCTACWTVFPADVAERDPQTRKIICPGCADCGDSVLPREEWTTEEVEELTEEVALPTHSDVAEALRQSVEDALDGEGIVVGETEFKEGMERFWVTEVTLGTSQEQWVTTFQIKLNTGKTFNITIEEAAE